MTTARDIIDQSMKMAGILGVGQTLLAEDVNDGLTSLQNMISQWQKRRWLQPSLFDIAKIGNNAVSNKIGDGQYWNTPRPDKIRAAYFVQVGGTVSFPLYPLNSYEDYTLVSLKQLNSWPTRFFYDQAFPYGNVFIWPIPTPSYEIHLIIPSQLGFSTTIASGAITTAGAGYVNGVYVAIPLTGGNGISAVADITVAGGIVTVVTLPNQGTGEGYKVGDVLSASNANLGGAGAGFTYTVNSTLSDLNSIVYFPPEYMEALILNLGIRLCIAYQQPASDDLKKLARTSLKTIVAANTQIPTLRMPATLRSSMRRTGIVNADGGVVWSDVG